MSDTSQSSKMREEFEAALIKRGHFADTLESLRMNDGYAYPLDLAWAMFEAGWLARGKEQAEWISVEQRLPEIISHWGPNDMYGGSANVLIFNGLIFVGARYESGNWATADEGSKLLNVTHWMPLPAAPTETGKR